jgi:hypothetical protein
MKHRYDIRIPKFFFNQLSITNIKRTWEIRNRWWNRLTILLIVIFYYPICIGMFILYYLTLPFAILNDKLGGI